MFADRISLTMQETLLVAVAGIIVVILELALITVIILGLSKILRAIESKLTGGNAESSDSAEAAAAAVASVAPVAAAPAAAPVAGIQLIDVDERTAAMIMAIVSNESGIPLEKLSFKSIRTTTLLEGVNDNTAAAIMAIVSKESGIPLERLSFKSIKKVEE